MGILKKKKKNHVHVAPFTENLNLNGNTRCNQPTSSTVTATLFTHGPGTAHLFSKLPFLTMLRHSKACINGERRSYDYCLSFKVLAKQQRKVSLHPAAKMWGLGFFQNSVSGCICCGVTVAYEALFDTLMCKNVKVKLQSVNLTSYTNKHIHVDIK